MARILVVDDDLSVRQAVRKTLVAAGYDVIEAENGEAAVEKFRDAGADLVLTDAYMPTADGIEATIRLLSEFPDARVVVMTGGGWTEREALLDKASSLGAVGTLAKPFSVEEIVTVVREGLATSGGRGA